MWTSFELIFELQSPLHIGYLPANVSVINPTRYYVPGRNFWGAVTKKLTEIIFPNPSSSEYQLIGGGLKELFRFSYFFLFDGETVYSPHFQPKGLVYGMTKQANRQLTHREFEHLFVSSRVSTAIVSASRTAKKGSLHDLEFIQHKYIDADGRIRNTKLIGLVWYRKNACIHLSDKKEIVPEISERGVCINGRSVFEELSIGGEQNYGFGRIRLQAVNSPAQYYKLEVLSQEQDLVLELRENEPIPGHMPYRPELEFAGDIELLSGREYGHTSGKRFVGPGASVITPKYCFIPGTVFFQAQQVKLAYDGTYYVSGQ